MTNQKLEQIYGYIKKRCQEGVPPTIREICSSLGIKSTSTAHKYVGQLVDMGAIEKDANLTRTLKIPHSNTALVPVIGKITAGQPITAIEQIEGYIPFTPPHSSDKQLFALNVQGDSMIEAGIFDGDIVIVEQSPTAANGDIVAAMIDDSATIKRFYKENSGYRLQPENSSMEPIYSDCVSILGRVTASIRYF